jgi:hypothetical protein
MLNISPLTADRLKDIRLIATDVDGTLTRDDKFTPELLHAIDLINAKGVILLLSPFCMVGTAQGFDDDRISQP